MPIWCTDANGQLGKQEQNGHSGCRIIGPHVTQEKTEPGNGKQLLKMRTQRNMIPMNTWHQAALTKTEKNNAKNTQLPMNI